MPPGATRPERPHGRLEAAGFSIGALKAFVTVVDVGSFSKAAQQLGVSQPNISSQISTLEQACGVRLLNRRTQNQSLTEAGRELYVRARLVVSRMADFEAIASQHGELKRGRLVVGFSTPAIALQLIGRFMRTYPDISVETRLGNTTSLIEDIQECRIDTAVLSLLKPEPHLQCLRIVDQGLNLIVPADHPLSRRKEIGVAEVVRHRLVSREPGSVTRSLTEMAYQSVDAEYRPLLTVESREAVKEAVANGVGLGCVLDGEVGQDVRLRALPVQGLPARSGVYLVCHREMLEVPAVSAFAELASTLSAR